MSQLVDEFVHSQFTDTEQGATEERNVRRYAAQPAPCDASAPMPREPTTLAAHDDPRCCSHRRRVYDALNVLIALDIAVKDAAKGIHWKGFPDKLADNHALRKVKSDVEARVAQKEQQLRDVLSQHIAYQQLLQGNVQRHGASMPESAVPMPFIICHTRAGGKTDCMMSPDRQHAILSFTDAFQLYDDNDLLRLRKLHQVDPVSALPRYVKPEMLRYAAQWPELETQYAQLRAQQLPRVEAQPPRPRAVPAGMVSPLPPPPLMAASPPSANQ